jgi:hypothetical protein
LIAVACLGAQPGSTCPNRITFSIAPVRHIKLTTIVNITKVSQVARLANDDDGLFTVSLIDPSFREQATIVVGAQPMDMAVRGDELFVPCQGDGSVHEIDVPNRRHKHSFAAGVGCDSLGSFQLRLELSTRSWKSGWRHRRSR